MPTQEVTHNTILENAAKNFSSYTKREPSNKTDGLILKARYLAFMAGAQWQQIQDKEILTALSTVYNEYMQSTKKDGKKPHMVTVTLNFQTMQHVSTILNKHL